MGSLGTAICTIFAMITVSLAGVYAAAIDGSSISTGGSQSWTQNPQQVMKRNAVQLCGARLVEAVKGICRGHIFSGYNRRSEPANMVSGGYISDDGQDVGSNSMDMGSDSMSAQYSGLDAYWDKDMENTLSDLELLWPPRNSKSLALKVLTESKAHQRFRRNISDECCKKPCSINDMVKYCGGSRRIALYQ